MQEATNSHDYERNAKWAAADEQWTALRETRDWKALEQQTKRKKEREHEVLRFVYAFLKAA